MEFLLYFLQRVRKLLGPATNPVGLTETLVSIGSALLGILIVYGFTQYLLGETASVLITASMGASAVLLFGVPHGALSQPWPLFGGHLVSAGVGVTCAALIPAPIPAAATAVALAIGAMQLLRCVHPPGGATALAAVIGGPAVHALGYSYLLVPVGVNVALIFAVALTANYPFAWRRYPATLARYAEQEPAPQPTAQLHPEDLQHAIRELNVVVDITPDELNEIARRALVHAEQQAGSAAPVRVRLGPRFVNTAQGEGWTVRKSLIPQLHGDRLSRTVTFNVMDPREAAGKEGSASRSDGLRQRQAG